ncbi:ParA family protein [Haloplanus salinarum]|uniref:ParA family protein n=1 Tax=Haloplanus salinarum TaxID=1912324 RepID=UPI003B4286AC
MLAYTTYSEAGGVGKTTLAANLGVAHARRGRHVLLIDLDPQDGCLTHLLGSESDPAGEGDNLVRHLIDRPQGSFEELTESVADGVDLVPSHNMLEDLSDLLQQARRLEEDSRPGNYEWPIYEQLLRVLREADVPSIYDVLIVDPPATPGAHLYNAIVATRSLVIPLELSGKGQQSITGLEDEVTNLSEEFEVNVGALAAVPNGYNPTKSGHQKYLQEIQESEFDVPVVINERGAMFEGCWDQQCSAFEFVEEHRSRKRDRERETLEKFDQLAAHLETSANLPDPEVEA